MHTPSRAGSTDDVGVLLSNTNDITNILPSHLQSANLKEENARLTAELREAREKIRNLELEVEGIKANTRKAVEALSRS